MFVTCFLMQYSVSFLVLHHIDEEGTAGCMLVPLLVLQSPCRVRERAGCLTSIVFLYHVAAGVLCFFLAVPRVG